MTQIPVVLFTYARPNHLRQTLDSLRADHVPLIYAYSDGPRTPDKASSVNEVRKMLRAIDWCEVILFEREENMGLGRSILTGVAEVLDKHGSAIIFEDDLICVPGTYAYLSAALEHYQDDPKVMSVTGWTHPRITPDDVGTQPYFDGRAECWVWGTWAHVWQGMQTDAKTLMQMCDAAGIDIYRYGADLPIMAEAELAKNIWAVRFLYWHILNHALCLRPPWSMVEHIGTDAEATNVTTELWLKAEPLQPCPPLPTTWPATVENPACVDLHQAVSGGKPTLTGHLFTFARRVAVKALRLASLR